MGAFSNRTNWDQQPNALNQLLDELRREDKEFIDLTESNPTRCGFTYPSAIIQSLADRKVLEYHPDCRGILATREAVAAYAGADAGKIVLTASTSESYSYLFKLLLNPYDKVLIPRPSYPLFQFLVELNDATYEHYPLTYTNNQWRIDFDALEALIDEHTKAIILVNPNNPTGSYIRGDDIAQLNRICFKHHLAIISDEVFFNYPIIAGDYASLKSNDKVLTFVLDGLSKSMGLPQMKLGWIIANGPPEQVKEALERLEVIADTYLSVNTPVQVALPQWLRAANDIQQQILDRVKLNLFHLIEAGFNVLYDEGGWYAIINMGNIDEEAFVLEVLRKHHLLIHPGFFFDIQDPGHVVVSLLPPREQFVKINKILQR